MFRELKTAVIFTPRWRTQLTLQLYTHTDTVTGPMDVRYCTQEAEQKIPAVCSNDLKWHITVLWHAASLGRLNKDCTLQKNNSISHLFKKGFKWPVFCRREGSIVLLLFWCKIKSLTKEEGVDGWVHKASAADEISLGIRTCYVCMYH